MLRRLSALLLASLLSLPLVAQPMHGGMGAGMPMMQQMHRQMMQNPLHRASMMAFMLPALGDTLELSADQSERLDALRQEMLAARQEHQQQMQAHHQQMMALFDDGAMPSADQVREHMMAVAELQAGQKADLYETAQKMRGVLTPDQRTMLGSMTPQQMMRQMMTQMSMADMMQMMQSMHSGMMGGGMMGQGMQGMHQMMNPGVMQQNQMPMKHPQQN